MKLRTEEKTITHVLTYVHIDDVSCEIEELLEILEDMDHHDPLVDESLRDKLLELNVVRKSTWSPSRVRKGDNYDEFYKKVSSLHKKKETEKIKASKAAS